MAKATEKNRTEKNKDEQELIEKLVSVRRVTKVVKGGKNMRFSALVVVGDGRGRVGFSSGKAREVPDAVRKATERAKKCMIRVPLREGRTLHHDIEGRFGAGKVFLRSATAGTGVIAGGPMRAVFEALGLHDVVSKSVGSSNYFNMVRATFHALTNVASPRVVAARLGRKVPEIIARREVNLKHKDASVPVGE